MHKCTLICCLLFIAGLQQIYAASAWQRAEVAARKVTDDRRQAIQELQDILLDDPHLHVAHYNLACILLNYQWQAEDDQRFGEQTRKLAKQALQLDGINEIDPLALAAEHFQLASSSPVQDLSARAKHNLALARFKQGRLQDALSAAVSACELFPKDQSYIQTRNELRRVYLEREDEARRKAEEEAKRLRLIKEKLSDAFEGKAYKHQLRARAGAGEPYHYFLAEEASLPPDLQINTQGEITGIPNSDAVGQHQIAFTVKDKADASDQATLDFKVWPKAKIITERINDAVVKQAYSAHIEAEGFPKPTWLINGLPPGISFEQRGSRAILKGSCNTIGTYQLHITVKDEANDLIAVKSLELLVDDKFLPNTSDIPPATAMAAYEHQLSVRGPVQPYSFASQGAGGLSVDEHGKIGGTAQNPGDLDLPLSISDTQGQQRSFILEMKVNPPPIIKEEEQITLHVGRMLNHKLKVEGGTAPFIWKLDDGLLPDGVRIEEHGVIAGAAKEIEEAPVTLSVEDRWGARSSKEITLVFEHEDPEQQKQQEQQQQEEQQKQQEQNSDSQNQEQQNQQQQAPEDQQQQDENGNSEAQQQADDTQEQQEANIKQADIQRWLDNLPEESKEALIQQLLGGKQPSTQESEPW